MLGFRHDDYLRAFEAFRTADFTELAISKTIGREEILRMPVSDVPRVLRRTCDPSPLNTLIRLFFLGLPVPAETARVALAPLPLETWIEAELLHPPAQGQISPRVQIWPVSGLVLAVDLPWRRSSAPEPDFVVPPGLLTFQLANAMIRQPSRRILDLGTGSGMLALLAAPYAETVLATDKNKRALVFTNFNARLNQIENVRCVLADLFEPIAQHRFQLILCNPPFVISPARQYLFRDSGERGDVFCRRLARSAIDHLDIGGFLQFTTNVPHYSDRLWRSDLENWFEGAACDVLALAHRTEEISDYAMTWILSTESKDAGRVSQLYDTWMDYFDRERIEAVTYLLITLRRSGKASSWMQIDDPPCHIVGPCGDELISFFEARDRFKATKTEDLLRQQLRLAPEIKIEQEYQASGSGLEVSHVRIRKAGGLQYPITIDVKVAGLLAACDGSLTLNQLLNRMAIDLNAGVDRMVSVFIPVVRSLIERGVLLWTDPGTSPHRTPDAFVSEA